MYPGIGTDFVIRNIRCNSSEVEKDDLFVCTIDSKLDRHNCIEEAIRNGASTIIVSRDIVDPRVAIIKVPDTNREFPYLCQKFYDFTFSCLIYFFCFFENCRHFTGGTPLF